MKSYFVQYGIGLFIGEQAEPVAATLEVGAGIDNLGEALNEVVNQHQFMDKKGYGETHVTGMQPIITISGIRKIGDAAQDFVVTKKYEVLDERCIDAVVKIQQPDNSLKTITFKEATLVNIVEFGAAGSTDGSPFSFEIHSSQKPELGTEPAPT